MDSLALEISRKFYEWDNLRQNKLQDAKEVRQYVYQTDTTQTTNSSLPWKNKTTIPKICQIRDNLYSNYMQSMFPKRRWLKWEGDDFQSSTIEKKKSIENYVKWVIDRPEFRNEISKLVYDFIDYGNVFATLEWVDWRNLTDKVQSGFVGALPRRISPEDIVFNPAAPTFNESPKIIKSLVSLGEVKEKLERMSKTEEDPAYEELFNYLRDIRTHSSSYSENLKDDFFQMDGFTNFRAYLDSGYCEVLTFYGNLYDMENDDFLKNYVIMVVDRHKVISKKPSDTYSGIPNIYHVGWRQRQDNLWAMGPLDNLIGMQYRIDHIENLKADLFDLTAFPPLKIKGIVDDFEWGPFKKIYVDSDGDVEILSPDVQALNANLELQALEQKMEEMAGSPREAMGFRTPGEKTAYEVQRLENAAARLFQSKIMQFEEQMVEPLLNGQLEMGRRNSTSVTIRVFDNEFELETFQTLSSDDITGNGRIRPLAARHFAETAERIQNLTNFANSPLYADQSINVHMSGLEIAKLIIEDLLDLKQYNIVEPFVRISEQAEAQKLSQVQQEQGAMQASTPAGLSPEDTDKPFDTGGNA